MRTLLMLLAAALLSGCAALGLEEGDSGDGVRVAAAFYPLAYVAERVAGQPVDLLTTPGAEPHDFELTVQETALVARADLVVFERGFQPAVDAAVETTAEGKPLDAAEAVDLLDAGEHAHEGHDHEGQDPHFWHDPLRMADLGDAVADALAEVDPQGADEYVANAADLRRDLEEIDRAYDEELASCARDTVVVSHDAFAYLEKYGLHLEPIAGLSPDAEPTPAHLAQLQELARDEGITTVFAETLGSRQLADTLAGDLGLHTRELD
ncbi:MAG: metal ABC transporter substrate-binding protein, partial [Nocardioides sp.]